MFKFIFQTFGPIKAQAQNKRQLSSVNYGKRK